MIVFIDTRILIGWMRDPQAVEDPSAEAAGRLMRELERDEVDVAVATVSVVTFLNALPASERQICVALLEQSLIVRPFDAAAVHVANMISQGGRAIGRYGAEADTYRTHLRLVGTAAVTGCEVFYSPDESLRELAALAGLEPRPLP